MTQVRYNLLGTKKKEESLDMFLYTMSNKDIGEQILKLVETLISNKLITIEQGARICISDFKMEYIEDLELIE